MSNVKKIIQGLDDSEKKIAKAKKRAQYTCDHQKRPHEPALTIRANRDDESQKVYVCTKCKKTITMQAPTNKEVIQAMAVMEATMDYLRIMCDPDSEKGKKLCEKCGDLMMDIDRTGKAYMAMRDENEKKAKKRNNRGGSHSSAYYES